jgi:shikimate 5-dehydrogenase
VDLVYADETTALVASAKARGATVIDGREVLMIQVMRQFARMTGCAMPESLAAGLVGLGEPGRLREAPR